MSEPVMLHVTCTHCGQKLTVQLTDWPEILDAATKPQTWQSWACPACMKLDTGGLSGDARVGVEGATRAGAWTSPMTINETDPG